MMWHEGIPGTPKRLHLFRKSQRYADVFFEVRIAGVDEHAMGAQQVCYFLAGPASWPECSVRSPLVDIQRLSAWGAVRVERPAVLPIAGARSARRLRRAIIGGQVWSSAYVTWQSRQ